MSSLTSRDHCFFFVLVGSVYLCVCVETEKSKVNTEEIDAEI